MRWKNEISINANINYYHKYYLFFKWWGNVLMKNNKLKTVIIDSSGNDEYYTPKYAVYPILEFLKPFKNIWCPFDLPESNFVKVLKENGFNVINTHISLGQDFFDLNIKCDAIVSNPPYSKKYELFERLFYIGKPFAMLVNETALFGNRKRFDLFKSNKFEQLQLLPRVEYFMDYAGQISKGSPPFRSIYVTSNLLENQIEFRYMDKRLR